MNRNLFALILIIIAGVLTGTFTWGRYANIKETRVKNLQYEAAIDDFAKLISTRDKIQADYRKIPTIDIDDRLDKMIPDSVDNVRLIIDVSRIIAKHGSYPKSISATSPDATSQSAATNPESSPNPGVPVNPALAKRTAASKLSNVTLTFTVSTTYDNMIEILKEIESSLRILDVTDLSFSSTDAKDGIYDFNVTLLTYWIK